MHVFISHSSKDKPAVEALAAALRDRGIDPWLDTMGDRRRGRHRRQRQRRIGPGRRRDQSSAPRHSQESRWVDAEVEPSDLCAHPGAKGPHSGHARARIASCRRCCARWPAAASTKSTRSPKRCSVGKAKPIPAAPAGAGPPGAGARHPAPRGRRGRQGRTADRRHTRTAKRSSPRSRKASPPRTPRFCKGSGTDSAGTLAAARSPTPHTTPRSARASAAHWASFACLAIQGTALAALDRWLPGRDTLWKSAGRRIDPELLGLPVRGGLPARRPGPRPAAARRDDAPAARPQPATAEPAFAGPLKILVAVAAPDARSRVPARCSIRSASCRTSSTRSNRPGSMRTARCAANPRRSDIPRSSAAQSRSTPTMCSTCPATACRARWNSRTNRAAPCAPTAAGLLAPIRRAGRPLPLVLLNACHSGVAAGADRQPRRGAAARRHPGRRRHAGSGQRSLRRRPGQILLRAPRKARESFWPSRALAEARKEQERQRSDADAAGRVGRWQCPARIRDRRPLCGRRGAAAWPISRSTSVPLRNRPVYQVPGPVPQLRVDDLIGRRVELRETLRSLQT